MKNSVKKIMDAFVPSSLRKSAPMTRVTVHTPLHPKLQVGSHIFEGKLLSIEELWRGRQVATCDSKDACSNSITTFGLLRNFCCFGNCGSADLYERSSIKRN